jgi:hypothetical protein
MSVVSRWSDDSIRFRVFSIEEIVYSRNSNCDSLFRAFICHLIHVYVIFKIESVFSFSQTDAHLLNIVDVLSGMNGLTV